MDPRPLSFFTAATGGEPLLGSPATMVSRVVTDSRAVRPGDLFVALEGERFDGHDYLEEVRSRGAVAVVIARRHLSKLPDRTPAIVVDQTRSAYGRMAAAYRQQFDLPVVCVGGSNGKTTTKEILATLLARRFVTLRSEASFNNDIGVPATLLRLEAGHQAAVLEAGTNHPGELAPLVGMIAPRIGIITSIGREHLEFFGDLAGVAAEEGALAQLLPAAAQGGVLLLNGECAFQKHLAARTPARVVRVGFGPANDWRAELRSLTWESTTFSLTAPQPEWCGEYTIPLPGRHSVPNALFGLAVACELGMSPGDARDGLAVSVPAKQRLNVREAAGIRLLDDTYNANADSMLAALQTLSDLPCSGRRVAVLGDMAELGRHSETAHAEVGRAAARLGVDAVFAVGRWSVITAEGAGADRAQAFPGVETAVPALLHSLRAGDTVLLKASRSSRLERLVEVILNQTEMKGGLCAA
ncbi:MAG TPA: UDP-N-acetylmuramoyl-tripeptide--D-alanyl-D-alanine ligase [Candidatus Limnocylindria bacterium]|nr:UDP-N-acetylmuramoyl-tripeptide--D-alanyl-D-alanine ligase [Candidatus Limnocylindria bacterium]